jgi:hypothetical protein
MLHDYERKFPLSESSASRRPVPLRWGHARAIIEDAADFSSDVPDGHDCDFAGLEACTKPRHR